MWEFEVRPHPADGARGAEAEGRGDADQDVTQGVETDDPVVLQDVGPSGAESAPDGSMDGGLNVDGAAVPSDSGETGDSAGLPGDEATMAEPARETSSIMGERFRTAGRQKTLPTKADKASRLLFFRVSQET